MTVLPLIFLTSSIFLSKILKLFSSETTNKYNHQNVPPMWEEVKCTEKYIYLCSHLK